MKPNISNDRYFAKWVEATYTSVAERDAVVEQYLDTGNYPLEFNTEMEIDKADYQYQLAKDELLDF